MGVHPIPLFNFTMFFSGIALLLVAVSMNSPLVFASGGALMSVTMLSEWLWENR